MLFLILLFPLMDERAYPNRDRNQNKNRGIVIEVLLGKAKECAILSCNPGTNKSKNSNAHNNDRGVM